MWLPYLTKNWSLNCSSRLNSTRSSDLVKVGVVNYLFCCRIYSSSMMALSSPILMHCMVWLLSNLRLLSLLKAALAYAGVLYVMKRV
jgi:hypothetical protein